MKNISDTGYNERLFSGGFRKYLHLSRFYWFQRELKRLGCPCDSILELGCFDGKLINYLPHKPVRYVGLDAGWENGLELAAEKWREYPEYSFFKVTIPEEINLGKNERFEVAVCMETMEHIPPELVGAYLKKLAEQTDGYFFITAPNEKGIIFLVKWLIKRLLSKDAKGYTLAELINATLGRMHKVKRNQHKGFDYVAFILELKQYFEVVKVTGHPLGFLPVSLCFGVGIVGKAKK